jgi:hypothetical protein
LQRQRHVAVQIGDHPLRFKDPVTEIRYRVW